jgi:DNA-binding response OmpR family regulator
MEATRNIPIIMVSAVPELETLAENAGADDFLEKPFNMSALLHIVAKYI